MSISIYNSHYDEKDDLHVEVYVDQEYEMQTIKAFIIENINLESNEIIGKIDCIEESRGYYDFIVYLEREE